MNIAKYIDHTILKPDATEDEIRRICEEAKTEGFFAVCVNPCWAETASGILKGSGVKTAVVAGFPLGAGRQEIKAREAELAIEDGADEIDMVINIGMLKAGNYRYVEDEIKKIKTACGGKLLKVIVETCLLSETEKEAVCGIVSNSGAEFIKTSTGFSNGGAVIEDIKLFKRIAAGRIKIKASGGIRDYMTAMKMIESGADRIGTSSSLKIMGESDVHS